MSNQTPGWYEDPENAAHERFWDGTQWTKERRPRPPQGAASGANLAKKDRPWYKKKRYAIPLGIIGVLVIANLATNDPDSTNPEATPSDPVAEQVSDSSDERPGESSESDVIGIGSPALDGKFEFTVQGVECGASDLGELAEFLEVEPQGQYCLLDLAIENIGNEAQTLFFDEQYLLDDQGREFSADFDATFWLDSNEVFLEDINPGNSIAGVIVFDIPVGVEPVTAVLHDSMFSAGVEVALTS